MGAAALLPGISFVRSTRMACCKGAASTFCPAHAREKRPYTVGYCKERKLISRGLHMSYSAAQLRPLHLITCTLAVSESRIVMLILCRPCELRRRGAGKWHALRPVACLLCFAAAICSKSLTGAYSGS
jgi:hypothetical protein